jgi:hypothetical protein
MAIENAGNTLFRNVGVRMSADAGSRPVGKESSATSMGQVKKSHILIQYIIRFYLFVCFHGRPRQATDVLQPADFLYRQLWTFQLWPTDAPAPTDAFRTLAAEVGTYGRGIRAGNLA